MDQTLTSRIELYVQSVNAFEFEFRCKCTSLPDHRHSVSFLQTHTPGRKGIQVVIEKKANTLKRKRKYAVEMKTANRYTTSCQHITQYWHLLEILLASRDVLGKWDM